ncbi:GMC family oxidoreductase [Paenibacillus sp. N4]|nr:GMC family oxidoreductase [Paenibacillus vietnamensis]
MTGVLWDSLTAGDIYIVLVEERRRHKVYTSLDASNTVEGPSFGPCPPFEAWLQADHWIPLTSVEEMAGKDYDVLIAGSGAGGAALLWRLCQMGDPSIKIGLIDAGGLLLPTNMYNLATLKEPFNYFLNPRNSYPIGQLLPEFRGARSVFALGGRTLFWTGVSPRVFPAELVHWPVPYPEMEAYYQIAEQFMTVQKDYEWKYPLGESLLQTLLNDYPQTIYAPRAIDFNPLKYNGKINSNVMFSSMNFLGASLDKRAYDVAVFARAIKVLTDQGKAAGVEVVTHNGKKHVLKAKTIVLSASTFETPRILLHSGIPGRAIGRNLWTHSMLWADISVTGPAKEVQPFVFPYGLIIPQTENRPFQIQIFEANRPERKMLTLVGIGKVESNFRNRVFLSDDRRDAFGVPLVQAQFSYSERDLAVIEMMRQDFIRLAEVIGATFVSYEGRPDICLYPPGQSFHESGTCSMGIDPDMSATNRFGQIHGVDGLYVADNSVLPNTGAASPTLSTIALAIRTADHVMRTLT